MFRPGGGWGSVPGNFFAKVLRRDCFLNWRNAFRTSNERSSHQDTDELQVKCSKPCLLQKSSPPIRDFNIKNRAPSPMTLACVASNKAAPPLHPQLPQLITSQRALFSHCKLPKNSFAQGPSMVPASNPSGCALSLHMLLPHRLQSLKPLPGQTRKFSHIQMQFLCFPPALGAQPQACPAITAAVARLHARLQAADFWAWKFLSRSFLSRTRIIIKQADSRKTIHPAMQSLSQLEFASSPS